MMRRASAEFFLGAAGGVECFPDPEGRFVLLVEHDGDVIGSRGDRKAAEPVTCFPGKDESRPRDDSFELESPVCVGMGFGSRFRVAGLEHEGTSDRAACG